MTARPSYERWLRDWCDIQDHLPRLHDRAHGNCMEIGVRGGVSTSALLTGLEEKGGHLYSLDIDGSCRIVFQGHPQWTFHEANSVTDAEAVRQMVPSALDLLFIDGDHSYETVLSDLTNYGALADRILLHDTDAHEFPGVLRAVKEYVVSTGRPVDYYYGSYGMAEITR